MSEWQTIDTEPKTGMYLIANALGQVCPLQWHYGAHHGIVINTSGVHDWNWGEPATHWMPLPKPPVTK